MRSLPGTMLLGASLLVVLGLVRLVEPASLGLGLAMGAAWTAVTSLLCAGAFEIARRTSGRSARAATIAGWLFAAQLAWIVVELGVAYLQLRSLSSVPGWVLNVQMLVWGGMSAASMIALVAAARWRHHPALATLVVAAVVVIVAPYMLLALGVEVIARSSLKYTGPIGWIVLGGALLALLARGLVLLDATDDARLTVAGLRRSAAALWLRLAAAVAIPMMVLMSLGGGSGSDKLVWIVQVIVPLVNVIGLAWFGAGAFTVARGIGADPARRGATLAGALSVWAAAVVCEQLPWSAAALSGDAEFIGSRAVERAASLALVLPIVAALAILALVATTAGLAARRGLAELSEQAIARAISFTVLIAGSLAIQRFALAHPASVNQAILWIVTAALLGLGAIAIAAKLLAAAAESLQGMPALPTATLREPSDRG